MNKGSLAISRGRWANSKASSENMQGELGRQQEEDFQEASRQMKALIDDAMAHGLAKPE